LIGSCVGRALDRPAHATSGQPTEKQLADIHALGVRHIVNLGLHTHEKALPDEAASVSRLGMTYIHIPVDFQNPTDDDFGQFLRFRIVPEGEEIRFAPDSPVEGDGFELSLGIRS
jgi:protein tyrosine phosphatase (PTP) superfamily phosphohydrolase (DUF442 family)